ncbi:MAG: hypothetical protein AMXMBFR34_53740 [Myxococcaceae bacterium]
MSLRAEFLREQLRVVVSGPLMRGTVVARRRKCGKPTCVCASKKSAWHRGRYLSVNLAGRTRTVHLREEDVAAVEAAVERYREAWRLIDALTEVEVGSLRRAAAERRRSRDARR